MSKPLSKILFAEDEPDIRKIATLALEAMGGFTLKVCNNGQEALDSVAAFQPDLLLFDVMMPEMDGPTAMQKIRALDGFENLPVIFVTAKVQRQEVEQYLEMGALEVIPKPFDPMTLADTVNAIWEKG